MRGVHRAAGRHSVPVRAHVRVRDVQHRPAILPHLPQALAAHPRFPDMIRSVLCFHPVCLVDLFGHLSWYVGCGL